MKTPRGSGTADDASMTSEASMSLTSEASVTSAAEEVPAGTPFVWSQTHNLILTDATGAPVLQSAAWPAVQLTVSMQVPLLYWAERRQWMWHKKWTLPKLHVRVTCDGRPVGEGGGPRDGGGLAVYAVVTAGTLMVAEGSDVESLHDQGLSGDCQRRLVGGEATFSSLLFRSTSSKCAFRPFHMVVAVLAPRHHPIATAALGEVIPP